MTKANTPFGTLFVRRLATRASGLGAREHAALDVVATPDGGGTVYCQVGTAAEALSSIPDLDVTQIVVVNGGPIAQCSSLPTDWAQSAQEPTILAGRNVLLGLRNGQSVATVMAWLCFHHDHFDVTGAVLINRGREGEDAGFLQDLAEALAQCARPLNVVLLESDLALGADDLPHEHHPFCVVEAPGKDRMEIPPSDPWRSPLKQAAIYEIARHRFLEEARAVANLDIADLLCVEDASGQTPFDRAVASPGAAVQLVGQHCYPWRVRKGQEPQFADHICVQFDKPRFRYRWCVAPAALPEGAYFRYRRISNVEFTHTARFFNHMAIRHPAPKTSLIVPKTSLVESETLLSQSQTLFGHKPVRAPKVKFAAPDPKDMRTAIVTTMKNEGPFILEWLAYHQAIGVQNFLVYTNDCTDGTDDMFDLLQRKGLLQHRQNPFREMELKPQHAALQAAEDEELIQTADWCICMDVDEFLNVKVGNGTLADLYRAVGDANMISCTWRLFGNADRHDFEDTYTIGQFDRCAEEFAPKPHQAWGFKTLFRNIGIFKKMGVHRPKGLRPQLWDQIHWVNGSGKPIPREEYRNAWRSTTETYGYDLVSLNHYAVRNAESFLVKRDRGRVNHVDRDQGLAYWFRMNNNATTDRSIMARIPMMEAKLAELMADPEIAAQHAHCVAAHRAKIDALRAQPAQAAFFETLTSARMEKLSRMHRAFGSAVFLSGPDAVPDDVVWGEHPEDFFFTVEKGETQH